MRRSAVVAVVGTAIAGAGAVGCGMVNRDVVTDVPLAGIPLQPVALGAIAGGAVLLIGGLIATYRQRRIDVALEAAELAAAELEDAELAAAEAAYVWPRIVVRNHGRPRRAVARVVTLPPPTASLPSPWHPSVVAGVAARTVPPAPIASSDGWLPDGVQRLPYRL